MSGAGEEKYLFLGVGGMGMAPLACWMQQAGYTVSGHDSFLQERVRRHLCAAGVELHDFVFPGQLAAYDVLVYSSAVRPGHPLLQTAQEAGLRCIRRGEMLAKIAAGRKFIAVAGSHGKTTTCGMIAYSLRRYEIEADYILGGLFADPERPPSGYFGSEWLIAEVDESDGTIREFEPEHTLLLNIDWDHADHYTDAAQLESAFSRLAARTRGTVWLPQGLSLPDYDGVMTRFEIRSQGGGPLTAGLNAGNYSAAMAVLRALKNDLPDDALDGFPGMARRQGVLLEQNELCVIEDYAHHPTEISALLDELVHRAAGRRLLVVFQPHRYSRTRQFREHFVESLRSADEAWLLPVYAAHESVVNGGELEDLLQAFGQEAPEVLGMNLESIQAVCDAADRSPALLAFVGAGDIDNFAAACVSSLRADRDVDAAFMDFAQPRLSPDCRLVRDEPLGKKTTMRIGGPARLYAEPANRSDLQLLLQAARLFGLPHFCLGRGSNLLVPDAGYDGLVIRFAAKAWKRIEKLDTERIWAGAGCRLKEICGFAARAGLGGFEFLEGIPGAVGGALRMNAGAMGSWMFDVVERVQFIDSAGVYQDWSRDAFHFGYRKVEEISRGVALGAVLRRSRSGEESAIRGQIDSYATTRKGSQPRGPSAGCIFKNPEGSYAGKLIDEHGLKGLRVGGAEVSAVHGNFIVNTGEATASDVIELVRQIRRRVKEGSGFELEPEVLLVGQSWNEVLEEPEDG